jgi:chemotaxis protein MotB
MATDNDKNTASIVIRRVKKVVHDGHHGGAWKVAYADFVTAMMAFFLLLWLLQVTTDEQKEGIADYFAPASVSRSKSGAGGVLSGRTVTAEGAKPFDDGSMGVVVNLPPDPGQVDAENPDDQPAQPTGQDSAQPAKQETAQPASAQAKAKPDAGDLEQFLAAREEEQFATAEKALRKAIDNVPELRNLVNNLIIDQTDEGLRIQIVDDEGKSMFPIGSAEMFGYMKRMLGLVVDAVRQLPQQIEIKGHTDSTPFVNSKGYSNWELSSDRANSSRRALIEAGLPADRISSVVGMADQENLDKEHPDSPRNRRISIILLREAGQTPQTAKAPPK